MIPVLASCPTVDGALSEWAAVEVVVVDRAVRGGRGHGGAGDGSARVRVAACGEDLYVAVEVRDDDVRPGDDRVAIWLAEDEAVRAHVAMREQLAQAVADVQALQGPGTVDDVERAWRAASAWDRWERDVPWLRVTAATDGTLRVAGRETWVPADPPEGPTPPPERTVGEGRGRPTKEGWTVEARLPLSALPRVGTLRPTALRGRVDVHDEDARGSTLLTGETPWTPDGARLPVWTLAAPLTLGTDPSDEGPSGGRLYVHTGAPGTPWRPIVYDTEPLAFPGAHPPRWLAHGFRPAEPPGDVAGATDAADAGASARAEPGGCGGRVATEVAR